jgi:hypothetical protein
MVARIRIAGHGGEQVFLIPMDSAAGMSSALKHRAAKEFVDTDAFRIKNGSPQI